MSKLNVDQKSIKELLSENHANFLIPDYQRPYAWEEEECQTLWDDIFVFAFPNDNKDDFNKDDEYFLGSIVTYKNDNRQSEIIDGQQRLTTIMLLLRAFYDRFESMEDQKSKDVRKYISQCLWKTDEFGNADLDNLKIDSEVATDDEKEEFLGILKNGMKNNFKSRYAKNYRFFENKIGEFINKYASYLPFLPARILNNCILLPIEADSQDTALRIFSTLNDRGLPLADADIFKAQFYKYYQNKNEKDKFVSDWKEISEISNYIFKKSFATPVDEVFTKYMYLIRAKEGIKSTTTESLRKFFEYNNYQRLLKKNTIEDLKKLAYFWKSIYEFDNQKFSNEVLKMLYMLKFAPNSMWEYLTTVYFFANKNGDDELCNESFCKFLTKITAFIFAYAITNPGVNALRTPAYEEMIKISKGEPIDFANFKFDERRLRNSLKNYKFTNSRTVTRSIITWYAFTFEEQELPKNEDFQIEHIYAKKRQEIEHGLSNKDNLEELGNKILLERTINIRASDYKFTDKKYHYNGFTNNKSKKIKGSSVAEIKQLVKLDDFKEEDIELRNEKIHNTFIDFLDEENLLD